MGRYVSTIEPSFPSGAWHVYDTTNDGCLFTRTFYGYTKQEAYRLFRAVLRERNGGKS